MAYNTKILDQFPTDPGVYLMKNAGNEVIYVGKAKNIKQRVKQYFVPGRDSRAMVPILTAQVVVIDTIIVPTEKAALLLECTLIKKHQPKYNILLKDDKTFVSLMMNHRHKWPMVRVVRYKGKPKEDGLYFGPYTNALAARQTFEVLSKVFPLRQCSDEELKRRSRPCLLYSIKRCVAPCVNKCTKEEYDLLVDGAKKFLKGENKEILKNLYVEMEKAAEALEFEKADALLRSIRQIEHVTQQDQSVAKSKGKDLDVLGIFRHGTLVIIAQLLFRNGSLVGSEHYTFNEVAEEDPELLTSFILQHYTKNVEFPEEILSPVKLKDASLIEDILPRKVTIVTPLIGEKRSFITLAEKNAKALFHLEKDQEALKEKMLLDLQETCQLTRYPKRIECFDTSNLAGKDPVASMAVFINAEKDKKEKRLYKIKGLTKPDDYAALHQVLSRRLLRAKEEDSLPDLVIVDGGKGQLNIALQVFKELDIATVDAIGIAKENAKHTKGLTLERIFLPEQKEPIQLKPHSPLLFFLQNIRDEAHRTAIQFQRNRTQKRTIVSQIDDIPGIGPIKRARLLTHFGSLKRVRAATREELKAIPGITEKDIAALHKK